MKNHTKSFSVRDLRKKLGLNQKTFWERVGVTQSGGSRYESGRAMPASVHELVRLVYVEQVDLDQVRREDLDIAELLKRDHAELYRRLRRTLRSRPKD